MPFFQFKFKKDKEIINVKKSEILGEWLYHSEDAWIFFVFHKDNICEYIDDDDDSRTWHYSVSGDKLKLWGADQSKAVSLEIRTEGGRLIINGTEYKRAQERWKI